MNIPKGEIIEARAGAENALRELLENLKEDFSGYIEVVGRGNSLGQILFFDGRPRLALFEGSDSRFEGREAVSLMVEVSRDYDTEIIVHRYPMVALLLDRFPEAEVTEETLGMARRRVEKELEEPAEDHLFNQREELASVLGTEPAYRPPPKAEIKAEIDPFETLSPQDMDELRNGLMKRLNLEKFYKKKEV